MVRESEKKEEKEESAMNRQYEMVKKIERELVEKGMGEQELDNMRRHCIIEVSPRKTKSKRTSLRQVSETEPSQHQAKSKQQ